MSVPKTFKNQYLEEDTHQNHILIFDFQQQYFYHH